MKSRYKKPWPTRTLPTEYGTGVLILDAVLPFAQKVVKKFEGALIAQPVLMSAGLYDTDAVELAPDMVWIGHTFRIYQWRATDLGLNVEPVEVARVVFNPARWQEAHSFCHLLVIELNLGPVLSGTARDLITLWN